MVQVAELLTSGDAARVAGVSVDTIRVWDRNGVLHARRTAGGVRLFEREDVERVVSERQARQGQGS